MAVRDLYRQLVMAVADFKFNWRMKKMSVANGTVIRNWVRRNNDGSGPYRRSSCGSGSISFVERDIRSYGLVIGRYYQDYVLILNEYKGSVTTQRHINLVQRAVNRTDFRVPAVYVDDDSDHQLNVDYLRAELKIAVDNAVRLYRQRSNADSMAMPYYLEDPIKNRHDTLCNYLTTVMHVKSPAVEPLHEIIDRANHSRNVKWATYSDPVAIARRERNAARSLAKRLLLGEDA